MQIVEPKVEFWKQEDNIEHIARCARVCYASKTQKESHKFIDALWNNKHYSMFRHAGVYYIIPRKKLDINHRAYIGSSIVFANDKYYVSTNEQCAKEYWDDKYFKYKIDFDTAENNEVFYNNKLIRYTLCVETGIDITREYNRKSPNNIAEQSTRYVDFVKRIGICFKQCHWMYHLSIYKYCLVRIMCKIDEWFYCISRSKYGLNLPAEDARWCLFLDTMSKVVYTYTVKEWEDIINMREFDYTGKAHKDAKIVAKLIHRELEELGYCITKYND